MGVEPRTCKVILILQHCGVSFILLHTETRTITDQGGRSGTKQGPRHKSRAG